MKAPKALIPQIVPQEGSTYSGSNLPVTRDDFDALDTQRKLLLEFVAKQLRRSVDFGIIPGTPKPSLFKPGAEKLARLFGLGARFTMIDKALDGDKNFALFNYKCEVFHLKSGQVIAECEGTANSQEKKYKERTVWAGKVKSKEPTPVFDILNTLQKMAQKRAYVGAIILATGASDFFTQDIDEVSDASTIGVTPEIRDTPTSVPKVTKVSADPHQHASGAQLFLVKSLTTVEERLLPKEAGFRWDATAKIWTKMVTREEVDSLPFRVERVTK